MKKLIISMAVVVSMVLTGSIVFAGQGKAIVPLWQTDARTTSGVSTVIYITNIVPNDIEVDVTFYDNSGAVYTTGVSYVNFISSNTQLGGNTTGYVHMVGNTTIEYGYAVIEWKNSTGNDDTVALVAHALVSRVTNSSPYRDGRFAVPVNNGMPF